MIEKYRKLICNQERIKLTRERIQYMNDMDDVRYNVALKKLENLDKNTYENLKTMAFRVLEPSPDMFMQAESKGAGDEEDDEPIEELVTQHKAEEMLELYKKSRVEAEKLYANEADPEQGLLRKESFAGDKVFIIHGIDSYTMMRAFKHYGLDHELTEEDKQKYA